MSYNYNLYADRIKGKVPNIRKDDLKWLCNKSASIYKSLKDNCVDNYRVCAGENMSVDYKLQRNSGCCGFCDRKVINPKTGNTFWIGFNYGH